MIWLLSGYTWLYIHRPFAGWPALGEQQLERYYMCLTLLCWACNLRKTWISNRLHIAFLGFTIALVACWLASPFAEQGSQTIEDYLKVAVFYVLVITTIR